MKKILSILLVLCMLFGTFALVSCEEEDKEESSSEETSTQSEQAQLLSSAVKKMEDLDAYTAKMTININMATSGMTITVPMTIDMAVKNAKTQNPLLSASMSTTVFGTTTTSDVYSDGSWIYVSSDGDGYKMKVEDSGDEYDYVGDVEEIVKDLPDEVLESAGFVKNDDGTKEITVQLTNEQFNQLFADAAGSLGEAGLDGEEMTLSNANIKIVIDKDGYIKTYEMSFKIDMVVEEQATTSTVTMKVEFKDRGANITVTPMEGYQDFEEYEVEK